MFSRISRGTLFFQTSYPCPLTWRPPCRTHFSRFLIYYHQKLYKRGFEGHKRILNWPFEWEISWFLVQGEKTMCRRQRRWRNLVLHSKLTSVYETLKWGEEAKAVFCRQLMLHVHLSIYLYLEPFARSSYCLAGKWWTVSMSCQQECSTQERPCLNPGKISIGPGCLRLQSPISLKY